MKRASLDLREGRRLGYRDMITDSTALALWDRDDRSRDLRAVGGLAGVRAIRRRLAAVQSLKEAADGRTLTDDELDRVVEPIDCLRSRQRAARRA